MLFKDAVRCEYYVASVIDEHVWEWYWQKKTILVWEKKKTILVWDKNLSQYHWAASKWKAANLPPDPWHSQQHVE
jgi:hypothetical protein